MELAPYGSWKSPITTSLLTSAGNSLSELQFSDGDIYWLEGRPLEAGRVAIIRRRLDGTSADAIPKTFNARTRVHEYGGGSYCIHNGTVFFSNFKDQRLYRQDPNAEPRPITPDPAIPAGLRYADSRVTKDGKTIICVRERHEEGREATNEIVALSTDGSSPPTVLLSGYDFYSFPRISPNGRRLAWTCWKHPQMPWDGTELWVADLNSNPTKIAGSSTESIFQPEWADDNTLYFVSDRTGWWNLYKHDAGGITPVVQMEAEIGAPQWVFGPSRYAFLSGGRIAFVYSSKGLDHLAVTDTATGEVQQLKIPFTTIGYLQSDGAETIFFTGASAQRATEIVSMNLHNKTSDVFRRSLAVQLDSGYLSEPEPIEFPTANGRSAFALFYAPKNNDFAAPQGERPPLLVLSHGGPSSATNSALRLAVQYWTSRGFAVVDVNYGGSTGYGRAYRERLKGQWGIVDVEDCINAARYLEQRGDVDGKRMAIRGGSAGGYTTLCALVFHDVFAAGASYYGVADLTALAQDTHKFESRYEDGLVGPYPEAEQLYRERSPVHFADRLSCPVILFQGLEDKVVPPSQAEILIKALRAKRLPFAYVAFPSEGHGFREAANIERAAEAEMYFYSKIFGFTPADSVTPIEIENL
jgi:dipeptidyl aminopeptidase/acylaminoacyl peptidase